MATTVPRTSPATRREALVSGWTGLAANLLLVLFFALAAPFAEEPNGLGWLGTANDWLMVPQFVALVPVAVAVGRRLPPSRWRTTATAGGITAMAAIAVLQLLLALGVLAFDVQVVLVVPAILLVHLWLLAVSLLGHRSATLPRPVTRAGVLIGAGQPLGAALVAVTLVVPEPVRWALLVPGLAVGGVAWLALPVWPLLLVRSPSPEVPS